MEQFGKKRLADFYIDPTYINVNHGSYGYTPKKVIQHRRQLQEECQFNNQTWFATNAQKYLNETRKYVAEKINCPVQNLFIVQNASDGINCIMKTLKWSLGDTILLPNIAYSAIRNTCVVIKERYNANILNINFTAEDLQSPEKIQLKVEQFVNNYPGKIKIVILDHIVSVPAVVFPIQTLIPFFQEKGIHLVIDGAHAIGNIPINIKQLKPKAYFSNFHKWAFGPKNSSFLYLDDEFLKLVRPIQTGNFHGLGLDKQFYWRGTRDFSSFLSIQKGLEYHESFGVGNVVKYNHELAYKSAKRMAQIWQTQIFPEDPRTHSSLINVRLPTTDTVICGKIQAKMLQSDNCYPVIYSFDNKIYIRLSIQIYNQLSDYQFVANKILYYLNNLQLLSSYQIPTSFIKDKNKLIANDQSNVIKKQQANFGKERIKDFFIDPKFIHINHASYGYAPRVVNQFRRKLQERCQFNTQKWMRFDSQEQINAMRAYIAGRINCPTKNVYLIQNATDGINCLLKSLLWKNGDVILIPNTAYPCVRKTVEVLKQRYNIEILDLNFTLQDLQSPQSIQLAVEEFVNRYPKKIRLAIFDHITSIPAVVFPIETIQDFLIQKKIDLFVDGAHALGQLNINIQQMNPSAYYSNFHKFIYGPKHAAFLYISDKYLNVIRPVITGVYLGLGPAKQYFWTGTRDFSSLLSIKKGIEYYESFGFNSVIYYTHNLAIQGAKRMANIWGTKLLTENVYCIGSASNVQVPCNDINIASMIGHDMLYQDNCFMVFFAFQGKIWTRLIVQIYNQLSDFEFLAFKFLQRLKYYQSLPKNIPYTIQLNNPHQYKLRNSIR